MTALGGTYIGSRVLLATRLRQKWSSFLSLPQVTDTPLGHVTRDWKDGRAKLGDLHFRIIDTSGIEPYVASTEVQGRSRDLTARVLGRCNAVLLLFDGRCACIRLWRGSRLLSLWHDGGPQFHLRFTIVFRFA